MGEHASDGNADDTRETEDASDAVSDSREEGESPVQCRALRTRATRPTGSCSVRSRTGGTGERVDISDGDADDKVERVAYMRIASRGTRANMHIASLMHIASHRALPPTTVDCKLFGTIEDCVDGRAR